jgi:hypothetical protein
MIPAYHFYKMYDGFSSVTTYQHKWKINFDYLLGNVGFSK